MLIEIEYEIEYKIELENWLDIKYIQYWTSNIEVNVELKSIILLFNIEYELNTNCSFCKYLENNTKELIDRLKANLIEIA